MHQTIKDFFGEFLYFTVPEKMALLAEKRCLLSKNIKKNFPKTHTVSKMRLKILFNSKKSETTNEETLPTNLRIFRIFVAFWNLHTA